MACQLADDDLVSRLLSMPGVGPISLDQYSTRESRDGTPL